MMLMKIFKNFTPVFLGAKIVPDTLPSYTVCSFFRVRPSLRQDTRDSPVHIIYPFRNDNRFRLFISYMYSAGKSHVHCRTTELHIPKELQ